MMTSQMDDQECIRRTIKGDNKAFEIIVRRYQKLVYNVVYQMMHDHETTADLTQETFLKAYRALPSFKQGSNLKPGLLRIATNSSLNALRDTKPVDSLDLILEESPQDQPLDSRTPDDWAELQLTQRTIWQAIEELPIRHRQVFLLRYQHDLSLEEMSEVLGVSVPALKSLLFRIREKLRQRLIMLKDEEARDSMEPRYG